MSAATDLVFLTGPLEGVRYELDAKETLKLGRKRNGLDLEDPYASLEHASVAFQGGAYWLTDLGSASGTYVNGAELGSDAVRLKLGDLIKIGEADIKVVERPVQNLLRAVLVVCIILASMPIVYQFVQSQPLNYKPVVQLRSAAMGDAGPFETITIPSGFVRREGVDHRGLKHTRTTDMDGDGVSEVWLSSESRHYPVSLDARNAWSYYGSVSTACEELPGTQEAPQFQCGGVRWTFKDGSYGPRRLESITTWVRNGAAGKPYTLKLADESTFKGFLAERGVHDPVHYLICEGWVDGLPAQVLTDAGDVIQLSKGCLRDVRVESDGLDPAAPHAVAFTAAGVGALRNDLTVHLSGGPDGVFLGGHAARVRDALKANSVKPLRGKLSFAGPETEGDAEAREQAVSGTRALVRSAGEALQPVVKAQLLSAGTARLDGGGCVQLEVTTSSWACSLLKGCRGGSTFLQIDEVGCGERRPVLTAPYYEGRIQGRSETVDVVAVINSVAETTRTDVLRTELYIRPR